MGRKERGTRGKEQAEDSFPRDRQGLGLGTQEAPEESYASVAAVAGSRGEWRPEWDEPRQVPEVQTSQKGLLPRNGETWGKEVVKVKVGWIANCLGTFHL